MNPHEPTELLERLAGRRVIASISGGKDSAAMSLYLRELGIEHDRVFMDTGWEADVTYEYLRGDLVRVLGPIEEIAAENQMIPTVLKRAMFPSRQRRYCTQELKVFPMRDMLARRMDAGEDLVNAVGIRAVESPDRSRMPEWEWQDGFDCEVWRPLIRWSEQDVIDIHARHGLRPNPLYLKGASRVGCWPCVYARKSEIRLVAEVDPGRIDLLESLEKQVSILANERYVRNGHQLDEPYQAGWFQNPKPIVQPCRDCDGGDSPPLGPPQQVDDLDGLMGTEEIWPRCASCKGRGTRRYGEAMPIRDVVEWARTDRTDGRQAELFAPGPGDAGCMRWGLCETSAPADDEEAS